MHYNLNSINENVSEIKCMLTNFSIDNLKWSCLFSGMGIITPPSQKDIDKVMEVQPEEAEGSIKQLLSNYVPINCIYSKGHGVFSPPPEEIVNPGKYMWDYKSFSKKLDLSAQAFGILSLCMGAELLYSINITEGKLMVRTARMFYDFTSTYLRNFDGLFVSGEDKTKNFEKDYKIEIDEKMVDPSEQIFIFEALLYLNRITSKEELREYHSSKHQRYLSDALGLFEYITDNSSVYLDLNTRDISLSLSSLCRSYSIVCDPDLKERIYLLIGQLTAEIETRVLITGEVRHGIEEIDNASMITHFRAGSALLEGYAITDIEKFKYAADRVYSCLLDLYNTSQFTFDEESDSKVFYSIRDIAEIIKNLLLHNMVCDNEQSVMLIKEFFSSNMEKTGIVQSIVKSTISLGKTDLIISSDIPLMEEINKAPVFLKNFRTKQGKKNKKHEVSKTFHSMYSLYASYLFLYYLNFSQEINN